MIYNMEKELSIGSTVKDTKVIMKWERNMELVHIAGRMDQNMMVIGKKILSMVWDCISGQTGEFMQEKDKITKWMEWG
jgi:hypothetical protein